MPLRFKKTILAHLKHERYQPRQIDALGAELGVEPGDLEAFREAVLLLVEAGQVVLGRQEVVTLPPPGDEVIGVFKRNPRGFGFIIPKEPLAHGDLFVPAHATSDALTGDVVRARVEFSNRRGSDERSPYTAQIVEVLERKQSSFTGQLTKRGGQWLVLPDGKALTEPVVVKDPGAKSAHEGDKVVIEMLRHPEPGVLGEGVITRVLGEAGSPDVETEAVIAAYNLREGFDEDCLAQARDAAGAYEGVIERAEREGFASAAPGREDRREDYIVTIDPPNARDFDDAISVRRLERGGWELGVHIADVSSFVTPGSALDVEAATRGNSVYLPRRTLPMLPELLSNGVCSLQEGVPRFCKSAFMRYDADGNVTARAFAQTCIRSAKRMTYLEAQALIDGDPEGAKKHAKTEPNYTARLVETLGEMDRLARTIHARRRKQGMIHLDLPQVELVFDDSGRVVDAQPEDDAFTHTLIEMFMVEANEAVARLFEGLDTPLLRRIHPEPQPTGKEDLQRFVRVAGFTIPKNPDRMDLQALLDASKGTPAGPAVHFAVLRTLAQAEYSPARIGHYALASEAYAHFTSPIRRYPDLTVHRALEAFLDATRNGSAPPKGEKEMKALGRRLRESPLCPDEETLVQAGGACNRTERAAADAEEELRRFLVMQLLAEHVGEEFPGVCTGVTNAGVFVRIEKYLIEGLVKTADLPSSRPGGASRWRIDPRSGALVEEGAGRSYRLGDRLSVVISAVDLARRQMEFVIAAGEAAKRAGVGKALKLGAPGGGLSDARGAGFGEVRTGAQRRSHKSKSREKHKGDFRDDRKGKGKRQ